MRSESLLAPWALVVALALAAATLVGCTHGPRPIAVAECPLMRVHPVQILGAQPLSQDELRAPFSAVERMEFGWPALVTTELPVALRHAIDELRDLLEDRGFASATVAEPTYVPSADKQWIDISVSVVLGPRWKLGAVTLKDTSDSPALLEPDAFAKLVTTREGDVYSRRALRVTASAVADEYARAGVGARAHVLRIFRDGGIVDVAIEVDRRKTIERLTKIEVFGTATPNDVRAVLAASGLRSGDRPDPLALEDARKRIMALGRFAWVYLSPYDLENAPGQRGIDIEVGELAPAP